ncbi:MAG: hypothetical protein A2V67_10285 [Deltaproteobacteria bacterium RBG_13_61_14]|nr:MAG: hypothetical protein A2V67_10285 [Deltaproteobacteria bacterium RBG_13_61_14]
MAARGVGATSRSPLPRPAQDFTSRQGHLITKFFAHAAMLFNHPPLLAPNSKKAIAPGPDRPQPPDGLKASKTVGFRPSPGFKESL